MPNDSSLQTTKKRMAKKPPPKKHKPIQSLLRRMIESLPPQPRVKPVIRRVSVNRLTDPDMFESLDLPKPKKPLSQYSDEFTVSASVYANSESDKWTDTLSGFFNKANLPYSVVFDSQTKLFSFVNTRTGENTIGTDTAFVLDEWNRITVTRAKESYRLFINNREVLDSEKIVRVKLSGLPHSEDRYDFQSLISS